MKAFHNDPEVKDKYLSRVRAHKVADEIIKGQYWENGKGCAVGCTIHGGRHSDYEKELGIPEWLAKLEDELFEGMSNEKAMSWPERFLAAIKLGVDLDKIKTPFLIFILENCLESMNFAKFDKKKFPDVREALNKSRSAVAQMILCHKNGRGFLMAEEMARSAALVAALAMAKTWAEQELAEWAVVRSAAFAAEAAQFSARSEGQAMYSMIRAEAAESEAKLETAHEKCADKLIELIEEL